MPKITFLHITILFCCCLFAFWLLKPWKSEADAYYEKAYRLLNPSNLDPNTWDPDPRHGLAMLDKAVELEPNRFEFLYDRGYWRFVNKQYDDALTDFRRACPNGEAHYSYCHYLIGQVFGAMGRYEEARQSMQTAIDGNSKNHQFWNGLALAYLSLGQLDDALSASNVALDAQQGYNWRYTKGIILSKLGRIEEAKKFFSETSIAGVVGENGTTREIYLDGEREYQRAIKMTESDFRQWWQYIDSIPYGVSSDYPY